VLLSEWAEQESLPGAWGGWLDRGESPFPREACRTWLFWLGFGRPMYFPTDKLTERAFLGNGLSAYLDSFPQKLICWQSL
jgi:hypothetical protein